jgi:hypothetical protein
MSTTAQFADTTQPARTPLRGFGMPDTSAAREHVGSVLLTAMLVLSPAAASVAVVIASLTLAGGGRFL